MALNVPDWKLLLQLIHFGVAFRVESQYWQSAWVSGQETTEVNESHPIKLTQPAQLLWHWRQYQREQSGEAFLIFARFFCENFKFQQLKLPFVEENISISKKSNIHGRSSSVAAKYSESLSFVWNNLAKVYWIRGSL